MRIEDNRTNNKCIMFKDLEVGSIFEHVGLGMIMIKIDEVSLLDPAGFYVKRNVLRIDDNVSLLDPGKSSESMELWNISPESKVIPVNAKLVIEE